MMTEIQEDILKVLRNTRAEWLDVSGIGKRLKGIEGKGYDKLRSTALGGPLNSLFKKGLVEKMKRKRPNPIFLHGRHVLVEHNVWRITDKQGQLEL